MESNLSIDYIPEALEGTAVLHLTGAATFVEAPELRKELFGALESLHGGRLVVELADVERMDTAAMAVLVEGLLETRGRPRGPDLLLYPQRVGEEGLPSGGAR